MKTKHTAIYFLISALLAPVAVYAADNTDQDRSSPKAFVKDSVITTKIKSQLAAEKMPSLLHIKVDTDSNGVVVLTGTAKTQADVNKAGDIARNVDGVVAVKNYVHVAWSHSTSGAAMPSADRVEARITEMHARLEITPTQEAKWSDVAEVMRDNERQMEKMTKTRAEKADMNAVENLESYGEITDEHADSIKRFTSAFEPLYEDMSHQQQQNADVIFRQKDHHEHKAS
jgi:hypothetical protein